MEYLFFLLEIIVFFAILLSCPKDKLRYRTKMIRILYIINTFCLLTSYLVLYNDSLPPGAGLMNGSLGWIFFLLALPAILNCVLRAFFIPYIYFALITYLYIKNLKENQFPKKETILFIILLLLSILGLVCLEVVSHDMWSALYSV